MLTKIIKYLEHPPVKMKQNVTISSTKKYEKFHTKHVCAKDKKGIEWAALVHWTEQHWNNFSTIYRKISPQTVTIWSTFSKTCHFPFMKAREVLSAVSIPAEQSFQTSPMNIEDKLKQQFCLTVMSLNENHRPNELSLQINSFLSIRVAFVF